MLAYKHSEAYTNYSGNLRQRPFVPRDKGLVNMEYKSTNKKWSINSTLKILGYSRIPSGGVVHHGYVIADRSKPFVLINSQLSYFLPKLDIYLGAENIGNYVQHHPIIASDEPFSSSFDASLIWGPTMGRIIYLGFRWNPFSEKKSNKQ